MQNMNIALPDPLKDFVDRQIDQGRYSTASEYVLDLIRADEKHSALQQLQSELMEGINSPESELNPADWREIRAEALARR